MRLSYSYIQALLLFAVYHGLLADTNSKSFKTDGLSQPPSTTKEPITIQNYNIQGPVKLSHGGSIVETPDYNASPPRTYGTPISYVTGIPDRPFPSGLPHREPTYVITAYKAELKHPYTPTSALGSSSAQLDQVSHKNHFNQQEHYYYSPYYNSQPYRATSHNAPVYHVSQPTYHQNQELIYPQYPTTYQQQPVVYPHLDSRYQVPIYQPVQQVPNYAVQQSLTANRHYASPEIHQAYQLGQEPISPNIQQGPSEPSVYNFTSTLSNEAAKVPVEPKNETPSHVNIETLTPYVQPLAQAEQNPQEPVLKVEEQKTSTFLHHANDQTRPEEETVQSETQTQRPDDYVVIEKIPAAPISYTVDSEQENSPIKPLPVPSIFRVPQSPPEQPFIEEQTITPDVGIFRVEEVAYTTELAPVTFIHEKAIEWPESQSQTVTPEQEEFLVAIENAPQYEGGQDLGSDYLVTTDTPFNTEQYAEAFTTETTVDETVVYDNQLSVTESTTQYLSTQDQQLEEQRAANIDPEQPVPLIYRDTSNNKKTDGSINGHLEEVTVPKAPVPLVYRRISEKNKIDNEAHEDHRVGDTVPNVPLPLIYRQEPKSENEKIEVKADQADSTDFKSPVPLIYREQPDTVKNDLKNEEYLTYTAVPEQPALLNYKKPDEVKTEYDNKGHLVEETAQEQPVPLIYREKTEDEKTAEIVAVEQAPVPLIFRKEPEPDSFPGQPVIPEIGKEKIEEKPDTVSEKSIVPKIFRNNNSGIVPQQFVSVIFREQAEEKLAPVPSYESRSSTTYQQQKANNDEVVELETPREQTVTTSFDSTKADLQSESHVQEVTTGKVEEIVVHVRPMKMRKDGVTAEAPAIVYLAGTKYLDSESPKVAETIETSSHFSATEASITQERKFTGTEAPVLVEINSEYPSVVQVTTAPTPATPETDRTYTNRRKIIRTTTTTPLPPTRTSPDYSKRRKQTQTSKMVSQHHHSVLYDEDEIFGSAEHFESSTELDDGGHYYDEDYADEPYVPTQELKTQNNNPVVARPLEKINSGRPYPIIAKRPLAPAEVREIKSSQTREKLSASSTLPIRPIRTGLHFPKKVNQYSNVREQLQQSRAPSDYTRGNQRDQVESFEEHTAQDGYIEPVNKVQKVSQVRNSTKVKTGITEIKDKIEYAKPHEDLETVPCAFHRIKQALVSGESHQLPPGVVLDRAKNRAILPAEGLALYFVDEKLETAHQP